MKIGSPDDLVAAILYGISNWCNIQQGLQSSQQAPMLGLLNPTSARITQVYSEQTRLLGWDNFLRGQISILWVKHLRINNLTHLLGHLISQKLEFSFALSFHTFSATYFPPNLSSKGKTKTKNPCNVGYVYTGKQLKLNRHQIVDAHKQLRSSILLEILWNNIPGYPL